MKMDWFGPTELMSVGAPAVLKYNAWKACRLLLNCQRLTTTLLGFTSARICVAVAAAGVLGPVITSLQPRLSATVDALATMATVVAAVAEHGDEGGPVPAHERHHRGGTTGDARFV